MASTRSFDFDDEDYPDEPGADVAVADEEDDILPGLMNQDLYLLLIMVAAVAIWFLWGEIQKVKVAGDQASIVVSGQNQLRAHNVQLEKDLRTAKGQAAQLQRDLEAERRDAGHLQRDLVAARAQLAQQPQQRPFGRGMITLAERDRRFQFPTGSAVLSQEFQMALYNDIIPKVVALFQGRQGMKIMQVIGHADGQPVGKRQSTLDKDLASFLSGRADPQVGSNVDLSYLRAVAVAMRLKADSRLQGIRFLPLAGADRILPGDELYLGHDDSSSPERRRVELRVIGDQQ